MPTIEITTNIGCKNACAYCPQNKIITAYTKRSDILQMSFDIFKTCVDRIPSNIAIHFSGMSEPWLNPDCTKMLLYAHNKGHKIGVFTTLVGMNLSDIDSLMSIPLEYFRIHLPSKRKYEKIRVDKEYLSLLKKISESNVRVRYHCHEKPINPEVKSIIEQDPEYRRVQTRAGNVTIEDRSIPKAKRGFIRCPRGLHHNVLLPNGDVILCCMDYGMQHVLGNLVYSDYGSLFRGNEFLKIKKGLRDESLDILCRYCDIRVYDLGLLAEVCGFCLYRLKTIYSLGDLHRVVQRIILKLRWTR